MINTLDDYIRHSLPKNGYFSTNPNLTKKVNENGKLLPFFGNTVVYLLDETTKHCIASLQNELYHSIPHLFSEKLNAETFHMTVHDLANSNIDSNLLKKQMVDLSLKAHHILQREKPNDILRMRTTWMFNMVNTSIVLGVAPSDEKSYHNLDRLYCSFEEILPLGYALTPHITLAYFRPGFYADEDLRKLKNCLRPVELELCLEPQNLVVQSFTDMNTYRTMND